MNNQDPLIQQSFKIKMLIVLIIAIILVIIGIFFIPVNKNINTSKTIHIHPNILYPMRPDSIGRNVYYVLNDIGGKNLPFSGVGVFYFPAGFTIFDRNGKDILKAKTSSSLTRYIVGSFVRWENIPYSKDKYIVLKDEFDIRNANGNVTSFPKIRVGFNTIPLTQKSYYLETNLGVEDLYFVIPKTIDPAKGVKIYNLGLIGSFSFSDLETLIKPGDTIAITTKFDTNTQQDFLDENKAKFALWLFIRRFNPKSNLQKSLNRSVVLK